MWYLKMKEIFLSQFWRPKLKILVDQGPCKGTSRIIYPGLFLLLGAPDILWLWLHRFRLCLRLRMALASDVGLKYPSYFSYKDTSHWFWNSS